jgi:hypothetical protein
MLSAYRKLAVVALAGLALLAVGCSSNNKGKIEGKWKFVSLPEKAADKGGLAELTKAGFYIYIEFQADGGATFGIGSDKKEADRNKEEEANQQTAWKLKYKLLPGDAVEFYDTPKELQTGTGGGLFGSKGRAKVTVAINGTEMKITDDDGTATLTRIP